VRVDWVLLAQGAAPLSREAVLDLVTSFRNQSPPVPRTDATLPKPTFTDDPLQARDTVSKAVHVIELRQRIDQLRARYGLAAQLWTDPSLTANATKIRALHVVELVQHLALSMPRLAVSCQPGARRRLREARRKLL
jgi:hypothetical protein